MKSIRELVRVWNELPERASPVRRISLELSVQENAKLRALCDLFPQRKDMDIVSDLLGAALDEITVALPYKPGEAATGFDEHGDPFSKDIGMTEQYLRLTQKYKKELSAAELEAH